MKIAIVGLGAMGSIYAALFSAAGHDVAGIDPNKAHIAAINAGGLRVTGASGDRLVRVKGVTTAPKEHFDHIVLAVKAAHVESAATTLPDLIGETSTVLTIQNGLGSADLVAESIGERRLAVGIASSFGASLVEPGHTHHNGMSMIKVGAYGSLPSESVNDIVALWQAAGFSVEAANDIVAMQWEKLICNVAYSAPCTLTGLTVGEVMDDIDIGPLSRNAAQEAWNIAKARGIAIAVDDPVAHVRAFGARIPNARPSMLQDHENGRRSEIDVINGAIPREAAKAGLEAPVNAALTALVKFRERDFV